MAIFGPMDRMDGSQMATNVLVVVVLVLVVGVVAVTRFSKY